MLHSNRVGQGLPISVIIIAAIGLIVLVIIVVMVQQRTAQFGTGLREVSEATCSPPNQWEPLGTDCDVIYGNFEDQQPGMVCCRQGTVRE